MHRTEDGPLRNGEDFTTWWALEWGHFEVRAANSFLFSFLLRYGDLGLSVLKVVSPHSPNGKSCVSPLDRAIIEEHGIAVVGRYFKFQTNVVITLRG